MNERATLPEDASRAPASIAKARRWGDLLPRVLSGIVMVALALLTAMVGGHLFALFWLIAAVAVCWEWQHLIGHEGATRRFALGAAALAVAGALCVADRAGFALLVLGVGMLGAGALAPPHARLMAALGMVYAGALLVSVIVLRFSFPGGLEAILWLFAVVWGTDVMAYFGGRFLGGPKLWPRLSPAKTWSGFIVGVGCGALAGLAVAPSPGPYVAYVLVGIAAGAIAQGGDLFESSLKRRYGVKDASHLIPGHGGVMDRLDGFITAAAFAALLGVARFGVDSAGMGLFHW